MFSESKVINHAELQMGRKLGQGGFGIVYQGIYRHNDVAIKQLLMENISAEAAEEFAREAKIMAQLRSPNIVQFYGFCVSPTYCIVMEYMPNGSLFSVLRSDRSLDWPTRFRIAIDMAKGLSYLHHENILHRDIKSLNVLLGTNYEARLTDFGLSKVKSESQSTTTSRGMAGTLAWMAPEVGLEESYTKKADIYSLGITFWELASRERPFKKVANAALIPMQAARGYRDDIPVDCPSTLKALIQACWAGESTLRPSADDVVTRLKSAIEAFPLPMQYQGNVGSGAGPVRALALQHPQVLPQQPAFTPALLWQEPPPAYRSVDTITPQTAQLAIAPQVDVNKVQTLLKLVAEGEQDAAERMLKANLVLALAANDVTDLSNRTFKNITAFQYAVWALDWHMWSMVKKYMTDEDIRFQLQGLETGTWIREHGKAANWQNLVVALDKEVDLIKSRNIGSEIRNDEGERHWQQQVGGAQRLLPVHVVNEYCHPIRSFDACPDFTVSPLPRSRNTSEGEWFTATFNYNFKQGPVQFGFHRGDSSTARPRWHSEGRGIFTYTDVMKDRNACNTLLSTRTQQRDELVAQYSQVPRSGSNRR